MSDASLFNVYRVALDVEDWGLVGHKCASRKLALCVAFIPELDPGAVSSTVYPHWGMTGGSLAPIDIRRRHEKSLE